MASDYDNSDPVAQLYNVSSLADAHIPSQQELDLLFGPLYDEFFNAGSNPQDTQPTTNIQPTSPPSTPTYVHAEENNDNQAEEEHLLNDESTNPFYALVWELVDKPFGKSIIRLKWLWKNKKDEDQTVIRNKARLVAKGTQVFSNLLDGRENGISQWSTEGGGLQIHQSPRGIFINQAKYALEILHKHGMEKGQSIGTPMATKPKLDADLSGNPTDQTDYRSKIESLITKVCEEQKQNMEDTTIELVEVCRPKDLCMHNNVDDLIGSALIYKLLSFNLKPQPLDKEKQEVKNIVEQLTKCRTRIAESLQNFRVIYKMSSISNTSRISSVIAIVPDLPTKEPEYSLSMGDERLSTIPETKLDEVKKSSVKNLVPIPSEFEVTSDNESECDVPVNDESSQIFTTFPNLLFDCNDDFTSSDDKSLSNENVSMENFKIYLNPLFDYLLEEFFGELAHIDLNPPGIKEADFDLEKEICLVENLLYDNSSPRPPKELNAEIADTIVKSLSPFPILVEDSNSQIEEIDLFLDTDATGNDTPPFPKNESFNFDHHDDPSFPRPPPEPPDVKYIQMMDYALWDVIDNGISLPKTQVVEGVTTLMPMTFAEDKAQRRLEVKARTTLMMGISNKHQLKFNYIKDAKQLMEAIEKRFGGNDATKKTQRNLLKQQYENFTPSNSEMLDQTFNKLKKLVSQLELLGEKFSQEFVNQNTNRAVNTAQVVNTALGVSTFGTQVNTANIDNLSGVVICAFLASQPSSPQLVNKDLEQVHPDDLEEMDLKWKMAMLTTRAKRECKALRSQDTKHKESKRRTVPMEIPASTALMVDNCKNRFTYENYNVVPPPYTGNFMPPKPDLTFTGLEEFANKLVVENYDAKTSKTKPKDVRKNNDAPIIKEWVSNDEEEEVTQPKIK
nr:ribonuclease H-like domain-containing protein [Tanacetum cinerariifolium]